MDGEIPDINEENVEENGDLHLQPEPVDGPDINPAIEIAQGIEIAHGLVVGIKDFSLTLTTSFLRT